MQKTIELRFDVGDKASIWETKHIAPKNVFEKYPNVPQPITTQVEVDVEVEKVIIDITQKGIDISYIVVDSIGNKYKRSDNTIGVANEKEAVASISERIEYLIVDYISKRRTDELKIKMNENDYKDALVFFNTHCKSGFKEIKDPNSFSVTYGGIDITIDKL